MTSRNQPLKVEIIEDVLTISIGVETLCGAIELNPELSHYDEPSGEFTEPEITDVDTFALEVLHALRNEREDGTTPVHIMLDGAAMYAIEQGAEGIEIP